jgi:hypothetical protein
MGSVVLLSKYYILKKIRRIDVFEELVVLSGKLEAFLEHKRGTV